MKRGHIVPPTSIHAPYTFPPLSQLLWQKVPADFMEDKVLQVRSRASPCAKDILGDVMQLLAVPDEQSWLPEKKLKRDIFGPSNRREKQNSAKIAVKLLICDHWPLCGTSVSSKEHGILELNATNCGSRLHRRGWFDSRLKHVA